MPDTDTIIHIIPVRNMVTGDAFRIDQTVYRHAKVPLVGIVQLKGDNYDLIGRLASIVEFQKTQLIIQLDTIDDIDHASALLIVPYNDAVMTVWQRLQYMLALATGAVSSADLACVNCLPGELCS